MDHWEEKKKNYDILSSQFLEEAKLVFCTNLLKVKIPSCILLKEALFLEKENNYYKIKKIAANWWRNSCSNDTGKRDQLHQQYHNYMNDCSIFEGIILDVCVEETIKRIGI